MEKNISKINGFDHLSHTEADKRAELPDYMREILEAVDAKVARIVELLEKK